MQGKERLKKEADHSSLAGGRINKQEILHMRPSLGDTTVDLHTHPLES